MHKIWIVAQREILEKIKNRSFLLMAIIGPLIVLAFLFLLFNFGGSEKKHWKVLVMDKYSLFDSKMMPKPDPRFSFDFINEFIDYHEFAELEEFQQYDMTVWVNEKVFTNKTMIVSYRERPSESLKRRLIYHLERRMDEIMVGQFTDLTVGKFREIKQPLNVNFKNTYDPKGEETRLAGWVGYFFGAFILVFVFLFGMTILRGVSREKTNRVVELLLAAVSPKELLTGKILGIGVTALFQFLIWVVLITGGLMLFRSYFFPDVFDPSLIANQMSENVANQMADEFNLSLVAYNDFVDLVYRQIQFSTMVLFFILFFIGGYLFYGGFFAMLGSSMGSESDGQQYLIPISLLLVLAILSGYFAVYYPNHTLTSVALFVPFSTPVVAMVKLGIGFESGEAWQFYFSLFTLFIFGVLVLSLAGRVYKNGILQFGHRLRLNLLLKWIKKT